MALPTEDTISTEGSKHYDWIDLIRVVAVFQVILIHLSYVIFFKDDLLSPNWVAANFYDSISRMGVPLFFMVSGFLLLGKSEPISQFFRKRFVKVGIPTFFWSVFYLYLSVEAYSNGKMSPIAVGLSMLKSIYLGNVEIHMWFLYVLIGIYLAVPILRLYVSAATHRDLLYFVILWFVATAMFDLAHRITGLESVIEIPVVSGYIGYFVLGYLISGVQLSRRGMILCIMGILASFTVTIFGTNLLSANSGPIDTFFYSYFNPTTILASICGFLLLKYLGTNLGGASKIIRTFSASAFGIYLIHIYVIVLLRRGTFGYRIYSWMGPTSYMIPATALVVFLISFILVYIIRKIPVLKMLTP